MEAYFPYSCIISGMCKSFRQSIGRHSFFGEWSVSEEKSDVKKVERQEISEIYY